MFKKLKKYEQSLTTIIDTTIKYPSISYTEWYVRLKKGQYGIQSGSFNIIYTVCGNKLQYINKNALNTKAHNSRGISRHNRNFWILPIGTKIIKW